MSEKAVEKKRGSSAVVETPSPVIDKSPSALKKSIDEVLFDVLEDMGFHKNIWNFDPWQVRVVLRSLTFILYFLSLWSWSHMGRQRYTFAIFGTVLLGLYYYWYTKVECGGGAFLFSPDWRDSFVRSRLTKTNYVLNITVGYELELQASLPLSSVEENFDEDGIDEDWLVEEFEQQFSRKWN